MISNKLGVLGVNMAILIEGVKPIKPTGEILTRKEFLDFIHKINSYYQYTTDEQIESYNFKLLYHRYREFGASHEEALNKIRKTSEEGS